MLVTTREILGIVHSNYICVFVNTFFTNGYKTLVVVGATGTRYATVASMFGGTIGPRGKFGFTMKGGNDIRGGATIVGLFILNGRGTREIYTQGCGSRTTYYGGVEGRYNALSRVIRRNSFVRRCVLGTLQFRGLWINVWNNGHVLDDSLSRYKLRRIYVVRFNRNLPGRDYFSNSTRAVRSGGFILYFAM